MKARYFGWRPTASMAKKFKDAKFPCFCASCIKAFAGRAGALERAKTELRNQINGQRVSGGGTP